MTEGVPSANPFSTRFIRPGALPYLFSEGETADSITRRLRLFGWWGQIVGPHGSGKSTLLATLNAPLQAAGRRLWSITLRDGQRRLPSDWHLAASTGGANQIVVDGYEQLSHWQRFRVRRGCRRRGWGLLVTTHTDVGLATVFETTSDIDIAQRVVTQLLAQSIPDVGPLEVQAHFSATGSNLRETLFRLYDEWETRTRGA